MRDDDFGAIEKVLCIKFRLGRFNSSSNLHVRCWTVRYMVTVYLSCIVQNTPRALWLLLSRTIALYPGQYTISCTIHCICYSPQLCLET